MASIALSKIRKSFGEVEVLHGIDLEIISGEFLVFVGPSGCGKSTLLRLIAGLEEITDGTLDIDNIRCNEVPPADRNIAMVFQSYALYPHMTVFDNMAFGLKLARLPKPEIQDKVMKAAEMLQLVPYLKRLPKQLSGGQRQRVAIGRAVTRNPKVFLFDEPLSNLDAALRVATRVEIANLKQNMPGATMVYVTHDQVEAMTLADRIVVLSDGNIEQVGTPLELYHKPENLFVARFIGSPAMNILEATAQAKAKDLAITINGQNAFTLSQSSLQANAQNIHQVGVRPEHLRTTDAKGARVSGQILAVEELGELTIVHLDTNSAEPLIAKIDAANAVSVGDTVHLTFDDENLHLFDTNGQALRGG